MSVLGEPITTPPMPMIGNEPAWYRILRNCGYPTMVTTLDWETYFDSEYHMRGKGSKGLSTIEYIMDERYEEMGIAGIEVRQPFDPIAANFWRGGADAKMYIRHLQNEYGSDLSGTTILEQNANFDSTIMFRKYGISPPYVVDLLALARHEESRDHNDLASLAERWGMPAKGDTSQFKGIHLDSKWERTPGQIPKRIHRGATPEEYGNLAEYATHDAWLEWHLFTHLLPRLSNPKMELRVIQHTLEMFTKPSLGVDKVFAEELIGKMEKKKQDVVVITGETEDAISGNNSFGALLGAALDAAGDSVEKYQKEGKPKKDGTPVKLLAIAKDDPELELLRFHPNLRVKELMAARTAIKSWPLHIGRVQKIVDQAEAAGGLIPVPLKYCGAHTGRWSGGEQINLQNLPSRSLEELINSMRGLLIAMPGYKIVSVDASQIEARITDWIAGEAFWLDVWANSPPRDPYCEFASLMTGQKLRKPTKSDFAPLKKYLTRMRGMGKVGVLGCGFGMGADKALAYAENSYGVSMTLNEGILLVDTYRKSHREVCKFWRMIEQKFKAAAKYGEQGIMDRGLSFHKEGDVTMITLPSGRVLKYHHVRVSIVNGREQLWMPNPMEGNKRIFMWGGYLTENVVQAMARDILAEAVLKTEDAGYHVPLHVHDEEVCLARTEDAPKALATIIRILSTPPSWAVGCPLAAEGKIMERYEK